MSLGGGRKASYFSSAGEMLLRWGLDESEGLRKSVESRNLASASGLVSVFGPAAMLSRTSIERLSVLASLLPLPLFGEAELSFSIERAMGSPSSILPVVDMISFVDFEMLRNLEGLGADLLIKSVGTIK